MNKQWKRIHEKWRVPYDRKQLKKEDREPIIPNEEDGTKLVIHNEELGIEYP